MVIVLKRYTEVVVSVLVLEDTDVVHELVGLGHLTQ